MLGAFLGSTIHVLPDRNSKHKSVSGYMLKFNFRQISPVVHATSNNVQVVRKIMASMWFAGSTQRHRFQSFVHSLKQFCCNIKWNMSILDKTRTDIYSVNPFYEQ